MVNINNIQVKAFVGHSRGIRYADGADRIGVDVQHGRFVVADGVSQSHLPNVWADILAHDFIKSEDKATLWGERLEQRLPDLAAKWRAESDQRLARAKDKEKRLMDRTWRNFGRAASTVAGVSFNDDGSLEYYQLGDSCIFMIDVDGNLKPFARLEEFGNTPDYVDTAGALKGKVYAGTDYMLGAAFMVLMTDALSDWFVKAQQQDTATIHTLWQLENHNQFWEWVEASRDDGSLKDDDVAMVLVKMTDSPVQQRLIYCDDIDWLIAEERGASVPGPSQEQGKNEFLEGYEGFNSGNSEVAVPPLFHGPDPASTPQVIPPPHPVKSGLEQTDSLQSENQPVPEQVGSLLDGSQQAVDDGQQPVEESIESQLISFAKYLLMGLMIANILFFALDGVACSLQDSNLLDAYWPWNNGYHPRPIFQLNFAYNAAVVVALYFQFWLKK